MAPFDLIQEAKKLIRFNTVTHSSNADCAVYVGSLFRKAGLQVSYQEARESDLLFMNVVGMIGKGRGPLLLATHLDTVDPGERRLWTKSGGDPWRLVVQGDTLFGLGVADTKLDILCKLFALSSQKLSHLKRAVILLGTFGEESGLRGAARFCQGDLPKPGQALVGEPSELALVTRHKGLAVGEILLKSRGIHRPKAMEWMYEVEFEGEAAHSSVPRLGRNAIQMSLQFLKDLKIRFGKTMVFAWEGGSGHNTIPASCTLRLSMGKGPKTALPLASHRKIRVKSLSPGWYPTLPWEEALLCIEILEGLLAPYEKVKDRGFDPPTLTWNITLLKETKEGWLMTFDLRALPGQPVLRIWKQLERELWRRWGPPGPSWQLHLERDNPPLDEERNSPLVKLCTASLRAARLPVKIVPKSGCSEAGLYSRLGIPTVVIGPGESAGNIHQPNERIKLSQLKKAIRFYQALLKRACF